MSVKRVVQTFSPMMIPLVLAMSILLSASTVNATSGTVVEVLPTTISATLNETVTVNVTVLNVQNLYGVDVALYWNSSVLKATGIDIRLGQSDGVLYQPYFLADNTTNPNLGKYTLAATSTNPAPPFNGSGNIVRVTFEAVGVGYSALHLQVGLYDHPPSNRWPPISQPIDHSTIDGSLIVIPEFSSVLLLVLFMALSSLPIVLWKTSKEKHRSGRPPQGLNNFINDSRLLFGGITRE